MYDIPSGFTIFREDLDHVVQQLDGMWSGLRGARIFITGGTGFFGIWLLESLLWANRERDLKIQLIVLSRSPERFLAERAPHLRAQSALRFITGTLADFEIPAQPCTHILHAGSESDATHTADWAERHWRAALDGTRRVLDMAVQHQPRAILVTTSGAVYQQMDTVVDQRCVEGPGDVADYVAERHVYGQSKRMMEIMMASAAHQHGLNILIARCFAFVGPYLPLDCNYAIGNFIGDALAGRQIVVEGDGTPLRSYLYAADLVVWLLTVLTRGRSGVPYNIGGEQAVSIGELARRVARVAGCLADTVTIRGTPTAQGPVSAYLPSLARVEQELGLRTGIGLDDALRRTLAWHRKRLGLAVEREAKIPSL